MKYIDGKSILATALVSFIVCAQAAPITIDTEDATIVVVRPLDLWSGDKSALIDSLEAHQEKTFWYQIELPSKGVIFGNPLLFQAATDHPIVHGVTARIKADGFALPRNSKNSLTIRAAVAVEPENIENVLQIQNLGYKRMTLANGDPEKYQSRTSNKKLFGNVLALGTTIFAAEKMGTVMGTQATLGAGISGDIYTLVTRYKGGLAPIKMSGIEPSKYTRIELRRVDTYAPDMTGQILIAYKTTKSEAAENAAMVEAIITLSGSKSTKEQIESSRSDDLKNRQSIWAECKSQALDECKE